MPLHPVKLPHTAKLLFRVVVLQKRLLKWLADPTLDPNTVNTTWVQKVWDCLDAEWVRKFCLGGQEARIKAIAAATYAARQALYDEFCRQNKVKLRWETDGAFQDVASLPDFDAAQSAQVADFFKHCYKIFSTDANRHWNGYELGANRTLSNSIYKEDFCRNYPTMVVCPYCDGDIATPELDHYLHKSGFPLLACSPWNLIPVCSSCNNVITAKGARPALTLGPPPSTADWLHPFHRPASVHVRIKLNGQPRDSIPQLWSPDAAELTRLSNHTGLIRSLSKRWTRYAASYYDGLVRRVNKALKATNTIDELVREQMDAHLDDRGKSPSSMIKAAVCQAVLDHRHEYLAEFTNCNPPILD